MEFVPVSGCVLISCLCENSSVQYIYLRFFVAANEEFVCVCVCCLVWKRLAFGYCFFHQLLVLGWCGMCELCELLTLARWI